MVNILRKRGNGHYFMTAESKVADTRILLSPRLSAPWVGLFFPTDVPIATTTSRRCQPIDFTSLHIAAYMTFIRHLLFVRLGVYMGRHR